MATDPTSDAAEHREAPAVRAAVRRRRPSPTEHARRVAWGHKFGPLVRAAYQQELERQEKP